MNHALHRRTLARIALAAAATMFVTSCGFVNTGGTTDSDTITAYVSTEQSRGLEKVLPDCEASTGVTVEVTHAAVNDLNQQLRVQLSSGTAADLFRVSPGNSSPVAAGVLGRSGELADLTGEAWAADLPADVAPLATVDGKVHAYPAGRNAIVVAYNKKVFDEAGVTPPSTWPELLAANEKLVDSGVTPMAAGLANGIAIQFYVYALAASLVYGPTPDIDEQMAAGSTSFTENAAWREVFEKFSALVEAGHLSEGALGLPEDQAMQQVARGEAGMIVLVSPGLAGLYDYADGGADDFGVFVLPATDSADGTYAVTAPDFLGVNAKSTKIDSVKKILACLAEPENANAYSTEQRSLPGRGDPTEAAPPDLAAVAALMAEDRTAPFANYMWPNADTQQRLLQTGQEVVSGKTSIDDLLKQLDAEYGKGMA